MAAKSGTICIHNFYATGIKFETGIFKCDLIAILQCDKCLTSLKCHRVSGRCDSANDVFVDWQTRIDIANRKNRTIGVPAVAKIRITTKRQ